MVSEETRIDNLRQAMLYRLGQLLPQGGVYRELQVHVFGQRCIIVCMAGPVLTSPQAVAHGWESFFQALIQCGIAPFPITSTNLHGLPGYAHWFTFCVVIPLGVAEESLSR